jgi:signal transduction histidine kinase
MEAVDKIDALKTISICLYKKEDLLVLEIADNGSGFDEKTAGLLFGRGFTTKSSGTGLGLHNCQVIIESHAGTISIKSEGPGKGALTMIQFKN